MTKKKKQVVKREKVSSIHKRLNELDNINGVSERVNSVIAKMTEPPETVLDHLKRLDVSFVIDQMTLDGGEARAYIVIGYDELVRKELRNIAEGGRFSAEYPAGKAPPRPMGPGLKDLLNGDSDGLQKLLKGSTSRPAGGPPTNGEAMQKVLSGFKTIAEAAKKFEAKKAEAPDEDVQPRQDPDDVVGYTDEITTTVFRTPVAPEVKPTKRIVAVVQDNKVVTEDDDEWPIGGVQG